MDDDAKIRQRLIEVIREQYDSLPYLIGYLTWEMPTERIEKAIDSWFGHNEQYETMLAAARAAKDQAADTQE